MLRYLQQLEQVGQVTAIDHEVHVKELPKTKRGHLIVLDRPTIAMLKRWRAHQADAEMMEPNAIDIDPRGQRMLRQPIR